VSGIVAGTFSRAYSVVDGLRAPQSGGVFIKAGRRVELYIQLISALMNCWCTFFPVLLLSESSSKSCLANYFFQRIAARLICESILGFFSMPNNMASP
jgi:hypothetical protein